MLGVKGIVRGLMAGVVVCAALVQPAAAQLFGGGRGGPGGGGPGGPDGEGRMFEPGVTTRDMERYAEFLELTPDQVEAAKSLLEGYQIEIDKVAKEARDKVEQVREEFRESRDPSVWQNMGTAMMTLRERRQKLDKGLLEDVKLTLTEDQQMRWPVVERMRRREATLGRGLLAGETLDVVKLVEDSKLDGAREAELAPILERYQEELDRVLVERNEIYEDGMSKAMTMFRSGDMASMQEIWTKAREAGMKVRDINRRFARQVEGMLGEEQRAEFAKRVRERSFPEVYRQPYPVRAAELARGFEDLTPEQSEQLDAVVAAYARQASTLNDRWVKVIEETEETVTVADLMARRMRGGDDPISQARSARRELDRQSAEKVKAVLTPEQASRLPDERGRGDGEDGDGGPRGRRGGGRGGQQRNNQQPV